MAEVEEDIQSLDFSPVEDALRNDLILKTILKHFDTENLLKKISLVSKIWCRVARSLLRSRKSCVVHIPYQNPCWELLQFNKILAQSQDHPFTGLHLPILELDPCHENKCEEDVDEVIENDNLDFFGSEEYLSDESLACNRKRHKNCVKGSALNIYSSILNKMNFHHLWIDWRGVAHCPAQALIINILKTRQDEIVELKIDELTDDITCLKGFLKIDIPQWLPSLKILSTWIISDINLQGIFHAAPQLQTMEFHQLESFVNCQGKIPILKEFIMENATDLETRGEQMMLLKIADTNPKLTALDFTGFEIGESFPSFVQEFLTRSLKSSSKTLAELKLKDRHLMNILPIILTYPLEKLRLLKITTRTHLNERENVCALQTFDWAGWFPVLETFEVSVNVYEYDGILYPTLQGITIYCDFNNNLASLSDATKLELVCVELKDFFDEDMITNSETLKQLPILFPNVKDLTLYDDENMLDLFKFVFLLWPNIESLKIRDFSQEWRTNFDAVFCGISEELAEELRQEIKVNGALALGKTLPEPENPYCILQLKRLKKLRIEFRNHNCRVNENSWRFFLSPVTVHYAFAQMPGFSLEIERSYNWTFPSAWMRNSCCWISDQKQCQYKFDHLKPLVKVFDTKLE